MGGEEDRFCLKWNDFQESISSALGPLLSSSPELCDVTLQCGPLTSDSLQCHRLVLAACSHWFSNIFKTVHTSNRHPVIVLWDTAVQDMRLLLDFMYHGLVNVKQENLNSFLGLAERLGVRGLTQPEKQSQRSEQDIQEVEEVAVVKEEQPKYEEGGELVQLEGEAGYDVDYYDAEPGPALDYDSPDTASIVNSKGEAPAVWCGVVWCVVVWSGVVWCGGSLLLSRDISRILRALQQRVRQHPSTQRDPPV